MFQQMDLDNQIACVDVTAIDVSALTGSRITPRAERETNTGVSETIDVSANGPGQSTRLRG